MARDGARHPENLRQPIPDEHAVSALQNQAAWDEAFPDEAFPSTAAARSRVSPPDPSTIICPPASTDSGRDSDVQIIETIPQAGRDCISDEIYTTQVRVKIKKLLDRKHVETNPATFSQQYMKQNLAIPLIKNRSPLITKAGDLEKKTDQRGISGVFVGIIQDCIPTQVGGRSNGSMKENVKKTEMITFLVSVWGVVRKMLSHPKVNFNSTLHRALEGYIQAMQETEDEAISELEHESNVDINKETMKIPPEEKSNGYLEGGATLPPPKHQICVSCFMKTTHYLANHEQVKQQRKDITIAWKSNVKEYRLSLKDDSVMAPINVKTGKPFTKDPPNPTLPPLLIVCKANKMTHSRGLGGYKCPRCNDRSCEICKNHCRFVSSTE